MRLMMYGTPKKNTKFVAVSKDGSDAQMFWILGMPDNEVLLLDQEGQSHSLDVLLGFSMWQELPIDYNFRFEHDNVLY